jgi:hypothetical protein
MSDQHALLGAAMVIVLGGEIALPVRVVRLQVEPVPEGFGEALCLLRCGLGDLIEALAQGVVATQMTQAQEFLGDGLAGKAQPREQEKAPGTGQPVTVKGRGEGGVCRLHAAKQQSAPQQAK